MPKSKVKHAEEVERELIEVPEGMDPKAAETALDEFLKGDENDGVTAPSAVLVNKTNKSLDAIRKAIEKLIKPKWDASETSRLLDCSQLNERFTLKEIKTALIPYIKKGWFATVTLPDPNRRNIMLTYEADIEFVTTSRWGGGEQNRDIFVRLYPREPKTVPHIRKIVDPTKIFGPLGVVVSMAGAVALGLFVHPLIAFAGIASAVVVAFLAATYAGSYVSLKAKSGAKKVLGPLLFVDDIRGYKTTHRTVTRDNRIQEVVESRVLEADEDW